MSDNSNSSGCWDWLRVIVFGYPIAFWILTIILNVKDEEMPAWAYFAAIPFAILVVFLLTYLQGMFTWLATILTGTLLLVVLFLLHLHLWISFSGFIFLIIGGFCAREARAKESTPWAINSLGAYFFGLVMIVVGIVTFFLDKGT